MTPTWVLAVGILSTSFIGSWHCAGMCGPMASLMSQRNSLWSYHLGRMLAYVLLGTLAGGLGQIFLDSSFVSLRWISAGALSVFLFLLGFFKLFPQKKPRWLERLLAHQILTPLHKILAPKSHHSGWTVGVLTAFLPCGWLYTYVLAAIATQSAYAGALTLFLFWLGGLPLLSAFPLMVKKVLQDSPLKQQRLAGFILIASSFYSLISFMFFH